MQDDARAMLLKQARAPRRNLGPFRRKHFGMERAAGRRFHVGERFREPGRGILGGAGKRAEPGDEGARASHDVSGLTG